MKRFIFISSMSFVFSFLLFSIFYTTFSTFAAKDKGKRILEIKFEGIKYSKSVHLLKVIKTRPGDLFNRNKIKKDTRLLMNLHSIVKAKEDIKRIEEGIILIFKIREFNYFDLKKAKSLIQRDILKIDFNGLKYTDKKNLPLLSSQKEASFKIENLIKDIKKFNSVKNLLLLKVDVVSKGDGVELKFIFKENNYFDLTNVSNFEGSSIDKVNIRGLKSPFLLKNFIVKLKKRLGNKLNIKKLNKIRLDFLSIDVDRVKVRAKKTMKGVSLTFYCKGGNLTKVAAFNGVLVKDVSFKGMQEKVGSVIVEKINPDHLKNKMKTRKGEPLNILDLKSDFKMFNDEPNLIIDDVIAEEYEDGVKLKFLCEKLVFSRGNKIISRFENKVVRKIKFVNMRDGELRASSKGLEADVKTTAYEGKLNNKISGIYKLNSIVIDDDIKYLLETYEFKRVDVEVKEYGKGGVAVKFKCEELPTIESIEFKGMDEFTETDIVDSLLIKESDFFKQEDLDTTMKILYQKYRADGFNPDIDYKVTPVENETAVDIEFIIDEGEEIKIKKILILGANKINDDELKSILEIEEEGIFSDGSLKLDVYEQDKEKIIAYYKTKGYLDAQIIDDKVELEWDDFELKEKRVYYIIIKVSEGEKYYFNGYNLKIKGISKYPTAVSDFKADNMDGLNNKIIGKIDFYGLGGGLTPEAVMKNIKLYQGKRFNLNLLNLSINNLYGKYFFKDIITKAKLVNNKVVLSFYFKQYPHGRVIKDIQFKGFEKYKINDFLTYVKSSVGSKLVSSVIFSDINNLKKKFKTKNIEISVSAVEDGVAVEFSLNKNKRKIKRKIEKGQIYSRKNKITFDKKIVRNIIVSGLNKYDEREVLSRLRIGVDKPFKSLILDEDKKIIEDILNIKIRRITISNKSNNEISLHLQVKEYGVGERLDRGISGKYNSYLIKDIYFIGLKQRKEKDLIAVLTSRVGYQLSLNSLYGDLKKLKNDYGFLKLIPFVERVKGKVVLRFFCEEFPENLIIKYIKFHDLDNKEKLLLPELSLEAGEEISSSAMKKDIQLLYKKMNFLKISSQLTVLDNKVGINFYFVKSEGKLVKEIIFQGFLDSEIKKIKKELSNKKDKPFSTSKIYSDLYMIEDLLRMKGITYFLTEADNGVRIKFIKTVFNVDFLKQVLEMDKGEIFDYERYLKDKQAIHFMYSSKGYIFVRPNEKRSAPIVREVEEDGVIVKRKFIQVDFNIEEGLKAYVEKIIIKGFKKTKEKVIRRELLFKEGELFNARKLQVSREKVYNLGFFKQVNIAMRQGSRQGYMNVIIEVEEQPSGTISLGGGYGTTTGFTIFADVAENNLFGNGQRVGVKFEYGPLRTSVTLSFTERWLFDYPIGFNSSIFYYLYKIRTGSMFSSSSQLAEHQKRSVGYSLGLSYRFWYYYIVGSSWSHAFKSYLNPTGNSTDEVFLAVAQGYQEKRTDSIYIYRDSKDNYMNPTSGSRIGISMSMTGGIVLRGDDHFVKYSPEFYYYFTPFHLPFLKTHPCVFEFRANGSFIFKPWKSDIVNKISPIENNEWLESEDRLYLGGPETLRGWEYFDLTLPTSWRYVGLYHRILYGMEFRVPIHPQMLWMAFFFDAGSLWSDKFWEQHLTESMIEVLDEDKESGEIKRIDEIFDMNKNELLSYFRYSYGFGFRIQIPMMPLRFWFGKKMIYDGSFRTISDFNFSFAIGDMRF